MNRLTFSPLHDAMQNFVEQDFLSGVSSAVLHGQELLDLRCAGWADREARVQLRQDHLFRIFSNTKLITSCAVLQLIEQGALSLDDPVERFIPSLGQRQVLRPDAKHLQDTTAAQGSITIRHLLTHTSGLTSGLFEPTSLLYQAYQERGVRNPNWTLAEMTEALASLPLAFEPGTAWEYSMATDVLARVIEVTSGKSIDVFLRERIFEPLGMIDTGFVVAEKDQPRLVTYYAGTDPANPNSRGLRRDEDSPFAQVGRHPFARLSGGGGLISSLPDMIRLIRSLMPDGSPDSQSHAGNARGPASNRPTLLQPETRSLMMTNQLAQGIRLRVSSVGEIRGKGHGLAGAITRIPSSIEAPESVGEFHWGGIAGTHWWINPRLNLAGIVMAQRHWAFWHPFSFVWKREVYRSFLKQLG
jgi:CubicO group peptidase (beta-lactamase class C family)